MWIDVIKNNMEYLIISGFCLMMGFGWGLMIMDTIWRMKDEESKKHKTKHERISDTQGVLPTEAVAGRKRSSAIRSGKEAERQNRG